MQASQKMFAVVVGLGLLALAVYAVTIGVKKVKGEGFKEKFMDMNGPEGVGITIAFLIVFFGGMTLLFRWLRS
jgi:hypothetical protein